MRLFESFVAPKLEEYISHRISFGYNEQNLRSILRPFDRYLLENKVYWHSFVPKFFLEFRQKLEGEPTTINGVISGTRNFFQFLVDSGFLARNPLQDIPALPVGPYFPYIFSSKQIEELLNFIKSRSSTTSRNYFDHISINIAILLMAKCGMRISEPLRLLDKHYRQDEKAIYIEKTKFNNDRLIPLPKSVAFEIDNYLLIRNSLFPKKKNSNLLVGKKHKPLSSVQIYSSFHQAVRDIGINERKQKIRNITFGSPTPHSLRHSFAVNTLNQIRKLEKSVWDSLPILSVYMGHRNVSSTIKYLTVLNFKQRQYIQDFAILHQEDL